MVLSAGAERSVLNGSGGVKRGLVTQGPIQDIGTRHLCGREGCEFAWGDAFFPGGVPVANTFQGDCPHHNSRLDGYERTSPVGAFPANGYGLLGMMPTSGNGPRAGMAQGIDTSTGHMGFRCVVRADGTAQADP